MVKACVDAWPSFGTCYHSFKVLALEKRGSISVPSSVSRRIRWLTWIIVNPTKSCRNKWFENTGGMNNTKMRIKLRVKITGLVKAPTKSMLSQVLYEFASISQITQS
jgi:hypothetical protein